MSRPLRTEFPNACYFVTSRGNAGQPIFLSSNDGNLWISVFGSVCSKFGWICHAYCLMENHYHIVVETPEPNLSLGMRQLNGVYTQSFNRNNNRSGHLFMGRFHSVVFQKERYLKPLVRDALRNPVRKGFIKSPVQWKWSSCRAGAGAEDPPFLDTGKIAECFGSLRDFERYVSSEPERNVWDDLKYQIFLGDDAFVEKARSFASSGSREIPFRQKGDGADMASFVRGISDRDEAVFRAYKSGQFTVKKISRHFGIHYSTVKRIVNEHENPGPDLRRAG